MTRVLMISSLWPPRVLGGAELYAAALAERLRAAGHEVGIVTLGVDGTDVVAAVEPTVYRLDQYTERSAFDRARFHAVDLYSPRARTAIERTIERFEPDVVHTHALSGLSTAALTTPSARGIGHVHTVHDYWLLCRRTTLVRADGTPCASICGSCALWSKMRGVLLAIHHPSVMLVGSRDAAVMHERLSWAHGCTRVVAPPVPDAAPLPPASERPPTFGYLGRLDVAKGVETLVRAFRAAAIPQARLVIGGDGPLRERLLAEAGHDVSLLGWLDGERKEQFFASIDALVVPSECRELAGLVVLEARARRLPVIGSRIGGIPELVAPESESLLFTPADVDELTGRLAVVAAAPAMYRGSPASAVSTWPEHLAAVEQAYADVAG
jgi:glycosyltransferase involved in cell wall biosynthesis